MRTLFLTSSPTGPLDGSRPVRGFDHMNGFADEVRARWKENSRCLMITAFPENRPANEEMAEFFKGVLESEGLTFICMDLWDAQTKDTSAEKLNSYDVVFLGGGHVPTQNAFFEKIRLKESVETYDGMIIAISAGTMNCADMVYAQPEEEGESEDPDYRRFLPGLGLTKTRILPHYQMVKDYMLDGKRLYEDITYLDSFGRKFLVLPDGSYLLCENDTEILRGEAYRLTDGRLTQLNSDGESYLYRSPDYISTNTGVHFTPTHPAIRDIRIGDIAHALSLMTRANGHFPEFFSVCQHCMQCAEEAKVRGYSPRVQLLCLLHDGSEAYMSDITRPIKHYMTYYLEVEEVLQNAIYTRFTGSVPTPEEAAQIKDVDDTLLYYEFDHYMDEKLYEEAPVKYSQPVYETLPFMQVERAYLDVFEDLFWQIKSEAQIHEIMEGDLKEHPIVTEDIAEA